MRSYENESEEVLMPPGDLESAESQLEETEAPLLETPATIPEDMIDVPEGGESQEQKKRWWRFSLPTPSSREQLWTFIAFWGVVLLGAVLRFWDLGAKPLHWDESLHAYFSMQLLHNNIQNWVACLSVDQSGGCYRYNPLLHGPFQFHAIAFVYLISNFLGAPDHGINPTTVRIAAALLGTVIVGMPYFLRQYLGKIGAWLACFLLAISPSMVYFSRFAREDIYMACFTLMFIVAVIQYIRTRKIGWAVLIGLSFVLSYATKEATFLSIAVFGSFAGALLVWEIASRRLWNLQAEKPAVQAAIDGASLPQTPFPGSEVVLHELATETSPVATMDGDSIAPQAEVSDKVDDAQLQPLLHSEVRVQPFASVRKHLSRTVVVYALLLYFVVIGIPAGLFLAWTKSVSLYVNQSSANLQAAQAVVDVLKNDTIRVVLVLGFLLVIVTSILVWREQSTDEDQPQQRRGLARWIDPEKQRLLDTIVTMPWTHWFFSLVVASTVFIVLFTALFTYMPTGIGDGIWQGLFYWITQETVARGGEPWYYYFMLIPLYEQIGLIFGIVGIVNCLLHPTRFRLFMVYWFVGNFFIYTWAGEKMPWLVIHMTMPLMILAAIGLRPIVERLIQLAKDISARSAMKQEKRVQGETIVERGQVHAPTSPTAVFGELIVSFVVIVAIVAEIIVALYGYTLITIICGLLLAIVCGIFIVALVVPAKLSLSVKTKAGLSAEEAIFGGILALLALILTLENLYQVTYPHPADAKSEMLIYVQTTPYVNTIMDKIAQLDQKYYGGKYEIPIGVTADATWPFSWYLRDYKNVGFNCTPNYPNNCKDYPVVIAAGEALPVMYAQNGTGQYSYRSQYNYREYEMRAQGNQGYMPPPCIPTSGHPCEPQQYTGVGPGVWLSWGATPPPKASFDPDRAMMRIWQWWWQRIPIGRGVPGRGDQSAADDRGAMMALFIRKDLGVAP